MVFTEEQKTRFKTEICDRISDGTPLRAICREEGKPNWRTVYLWLEEDPEFNAHFAHAREIGYDAIAADALLIADTPQEGVKYEDGPLGSKEVREDMLGHRKLQIETRLKLLAKWSPKKYGDKVDHISSDGSMSQNPTVIELVAPDK
jgi:hypothetical protein